VNLQVGHFSNYSAKNTFWLIELDLDSFKMTYDGYWDAAMEMAEQRAKRMEEHYYLVCDSNGKNIGKRYYDEEEAKKEFVHSFGNGIFKWEDFKAKGFYIKSVNASEIKKQIESLQSLLK
jgi:hypothetical protein